MLDTLGSSAHFEHVSYNAVATARSKMRDDAQSSTLWRELAAGRWSLVERFEADGRQYLTAQKNPLEVQASCALSVREEQLVRGAALGHSNKYLAYEFDISPSRVCTALKCARHKLGVRSRLELFQLALSERAELVASLETCDYLTFACDLPKGNALASLTEGELLVFQGILAELSNAEIAAGRGTSPRTVANQIASIFRKLSANSRSELVAKYSSGSAAHSLVSNP